MSSEGFGNHQSLAALWATLLLMDFVSAGTEEPGKETFTLSTVTDAASWLVMLSRKIMRPLVFSLDVSGAMGRKTTLPDSNGSTATSRFGILIGRSSRCE